MEVLWLTWRQHRMQVLVTTALLVVLGVVLLISGLGAAGFAAQNAPATDCVADTPACSAYRVEMNERIHSVGELLGWLPLLAPALIGAFWGAPLLAREFEHGTHQLTWTQSVTRRRWLAAKIVGLGAAVTLGGLVLAGIVEPWLAAFDVPPYNVDRFDMSWFRVVGIMPAAWWLSAFLLGMATGALFRRTLPAMAVTLGVCALAFFGLLRAPSSYAPPERAVQAQVIDELEPEDSLYVTSYWIDSSGAKFTSQERHLALAGPCGTDETTKKYAQCTFSHGYRQVVEFHPADRFWQFQWTEAGILLIPALSLGGVAVRRALRPRI
ncbi:ABC transporter permease subunit [Nonomuraea sp. MCN248]|uniref:ABC transporter permease subunit n=1 Tax=Nonomuraea corallina TaxID=2989783 RepID=A0ABT4SEB9_9ACTN|nr:ABC transporter permease subunit [Nonomuraea corallina]MDA0635544.1 ABC transporter permease subunit [Nonomuraea corallina]